MPRSRETNERMRAESREHILVAARRLFAERGYFSCKVSDVARAAGMSQGNVFWYFPAKEDILKEILRAGFSSVEEMTLEVAAYPGTARQKLELLIGRALAVYRQQSEFAAISLGVLAHSGPAFLDALGFDPQEIGARYHGALSDVFAQARAEGTVAGLDPDILVMFFFALLNGLVATYGAEWPELPDELIRDAVLRLLGVPPERGG
jgi:TetR/AcrR family transcriptional regulator, fatty acid metabolism regulator protein